MTQSPYYPGDIQLRWNALKQSLGGFRVVLICRKFIFVIENHLHAMRTSI